MSNPVLRREVVERWRSRRAPMTLTIYLSVLGLIMYALYRMGVAILRSGFGFGFDASTAGPMLGRFLVEGLFFFVLLLVLFVGPGYAAAQISGERERRTLTLLQVTLLSPFQIVLGKLGASVAWLSLLVVAAVPLGAVAFFLGGIGITDLLRGFFTLIVVALSVAAMALGISSLTKRTTGSIVLTYGVVLALTLGTFFLAGVEAVLRATNNQDVRTPVSLYLNPFFALADAVNASSIDDGMGLPSPLGLIALTLPHSPVMQDEFGMGVQGGDVGGGGVVEMEMEMEAVPEGRPARRTRVETFEAAPDPEALPRAKRRALRRAQREMAIEEGAAPDLDEARAVEALPAPRELPAPQEAPMQVLPVEPRNPGRQPVWLIVLTLYLLLGGVGLLVATRRLGRTEPRMRAAPVGAVTTGGPPVASPGAVPGAAPGAPPGAPSGPPPGWEQPR